MNVKKINLYPKFAFLKEYCKKAIHYAKEI